MTKIDSLEQKVKHLEHNLRCKTQFVDELPLEGKECSLYVLPDGSIYIWDGTTFITADDTVQFVDTLPVTGIENILYVLPDGTIHIWDGTTFIASGVSDHGSLTGLGDDDHTQYVLLAGRSGGQLINGGTVAGNSLTLSSTTNVTKGSIIFGDSRYNESTNRFVLGTATGTGRINLPDAGTTASDGIQFGQLASIFRNSVLGGISYQSPQDHVFRIGVNNILNLYASNIELNRSSFIAPSPLTGSQSTSALNITQAWNTTGSPTALNVDITNTASGASANFAEFKLGGVSRLKFTKNGLISFDTSGSGISFYGTGIFFKTSNARISYDCGTGSNPAHLFSRGEIGITKSGTEYVPPASSIVAIESTTQGFLPPRGTNAQMLAIASPAPGLIFYDTTNNLLNFYNGTIWVPL